MVKLTINGKEVNVPEGTALIQACEIVGVEIPRFCYHSRLKVAGNCRMCLVEVEKTRKPVASCAMPVSENMVVHTDSELVKNARKGVMEFLLINHPLDCPVCDEAGECDLQDQAMAYGKGESRFEENKRIVPDHYMGPLIKTHMTRCIHCTRCVRFGSDVAGVEELGTFGRGENMRIDTYLSKAITSELSGNMIDVCPVGALGSKPYEYKARAWELTKTESIDVLDAVGSNIRIDTRGVEVMRILPRLNEEINEEWISDKTRFSYDGLKTQRLDTPYVRVDGKLKAATWEEAFAAIKKNISKLKSAEIAAISGPLADCESMMVLRDIMRSLGVQNLDCIRTGVNIDYSGRGNYLFNTSIAGIEKSDLCLLVGANPRHEATMVNAKLRKRFVQGGYKVYSIGDELDLTYPVNNLGANPEILNEILAGKSEITQALKSSKNPMIIIGYGALSRKDSQQILSLCSQIAEKYKLVQKDWNGFNVLHRDASTVGGIDLGFVHGDEGKNTNSILEDVKSRKIKFLYLLGADDIDTAQIAGKGFIVYQGHHGDKGALIADVILPGAAYTEKDATYVNLEGRAQRARRAVQPPNMAREDAEILVLLAKHLKIKLNYKNKDELRIELAKQSEAFANIDKLVASKWVGIEKNNIKIDSAPIRCLDINYYQSNSICRASSTMAKCADQFQVKQC